MRLFVGLVQGEVDERRQRAIVGAFACIGKNVDISQRIVEKLVKEYSTSPRSPRALAPPRLRFRPLPAA